jgi:hypothetical protein
MENKQRRFVGAVMLALSLILATMVAVILFPSAALIWAVKFVFGMTLAIVILALFVFGVVFISGGSNG